MTPVIGRIEFLTPRVTEGPRALGIVAGDWNSATLTLTTRKYGHKGVGAFEGRSVGRTVGSWEGWNVSLHTADVNSYCEM